MVNYVNPDGSHNSMFFSNTDTTKYGLATASNNVAAANGQVSCQGGGSSNRRVRTKVLMAKSHKKINKRKIKNISNMYRMKSRRHTKKMKRMLRSRANRKRRGTRRHYSRSRMQRGGTYQQFGSNMAVGSSYTLNPNVPSALANPMPFKSVSDCGDVNHFNNPATNSNAGSMFSNLKNLF